MNSANRPKHDFFYTYTGHFFQYCKSECGNIAKYGTSKCIKAPSKFYTSRRGIAHSFMKPSDNFVWGTDWYWSCCFFFFKESINVDIY